MVGVVGVSNEGCGYEVISSPSRNTYMVIFDDHGFGVHQRSALSHHISSGVLKNKLYPSVMGRGCIGVGSFKAKRHGKQTAEYVLWYHMLERCYSPAYLRTHPTYAECSVEHSWLNFQNFCNDLPTLYGYDTWLNQPRSMHLDKDIKVPGNSVYSTHTCMFVHPAQNIQESNTTGCVYIGRRIHDNYSEEFTQQNTFASKYGLDRKKICECIKGRQKKHKGWLFNIKEYV